MYIIAGPNGSGKTTFTVKFLPEMRFAASIDLFSNFFKLYHFGYE